uniref:C-type lectin domain-containing protein n=1 Tax=Oryzias sinensis TaxID=183150 RepID=A0A8C7XN29_9TELE
MYLSSLRTEVSLVFVFVFSCFCRFLVSYLGVSVFGRFGEFCYKPFGDRKTWQDAQRVCRDLGAELVSIMSMKEQSWVESYFYMGKALEKTTNNLWTGLNDLLVPGMFTWSDDFEVTFTYWAPGEPNNHNGFSEDCVEMLYETGRWNDKSCSELNNYICKKPKMNALNLYQFHILSIITNITIRNLETLSQH